MLTGIWSRRAGSAASGLVVAFYMACGTATALQLDSITPNGGTFLGGTSVTLAGDFSVAVDSPELTTYEIFFSHDSTIGGDVEGTVSMATDSSIAGMTPPAGPGVYNVYVRATNGLQTFNSNLIAYTFIGDSTGANTDLGDEAQALIDGFAGAAGADGALSFNEAQNVVSGLTQELFDDLDLNNDGVLTEAELQLTVDVAPVGEGETSTTEELRQVLEAAFNIVDADEDGGISLEEANEFLLRSGLRELTADEFADWEADGNGTLSRQELEPEVGTPASGCFRSPGAEKADSAPSWFEIIEELLPVLLAMIVLGGVRDVRRG